MSDGTAAGGRTGFFGDYATWQAAADDSTSMTIPERDAASERNAALMRRVRDGEIAYMRDGVTFDRVELPFPLLSFLQRIALEDGGRLRLVDFGGSLGVSYFQTREFLSALSEIRWAVVDLPEVVRCGREQFTTAELSFHDTLGEARHAIGARAALLSGVLTYIPDTDELLAELTRGEFEWILFDRTPLIDAERPRIVVQAVAGEQGEISWPCRMMTRDALLQPFARAYDLVAEFPSYCDGDEWLDGMAIRHRGFALRRRRVDAAAAR